MVLLILEILLLVGGAVTLFKGEIPRFVFGKATDNFTLDAGRARIIGVVLMLPLPAALCAGLAIGLVMATQGNGNTLAVSLFEWVLVIGAVGVAWLLWRTWREDKFVDTMAAPETSDAA